MPVYRVENPMEYAKRMQDVIVTCPNCGHRNTMPVFYDNKICHHCKHKIINNTQAYFKYKLRKEMEKKKYEEDKMGKNRKENT